LVVDVGGNFGWFSTFSALLGCRWVGGMEEVWGLVGMGVFWCAGVARESLV
jgi:hypothetical protein